MHHDLIYKLNQKIYNFNWYTKSNKILKSILAGVFIGIGAILMLTIGSLITDNIRIISMGICFSLALILIVLGSGELFTGHCMYQTSSLVYKRQDIKQYMSNLGLIWLGNFIGALIISLLFLSTSPSQHTLEFIYNISLLKTSFSIPILLFKGILCNILVCLALYLALKSEDLIYKMLIILFCVFTFVVCGFEHSIANMSILSLGVYTGLPVSNLVYNLLFVTIGNYIGAVLLFNLFNLIAKED